MITNCDCRSEHGVPSRLGFYTGNALDRDRFHHIGARLRVDNLGDARDVPRLAKRTDSIARPSVEPIASQHRPHGFGILCAVSASTCYRIDSGIPRDS